MQNDNFDEIDLKEIWSMIVKKMNKEGEEVCPNFIKFLQNARWYRVFFAKKKRRFNWHLL